MATEGNIDICRNGVAYSEFQSFNRDLSLKVMKGHFERTGRAEEPLTYLDLFCGSGIRSLLFCHEFPQHGIVVGVDSSANSISIATENAIRNQEGAMEFLCQDINSLDLSRFSAFDVVELDPFGGCMPFVEKCIPFLRHEGILNLTFTNSRELFPSAEADGFTYLTHGVTRPHPDIGCHEFGLRSTWLALSNMLFANSREIRPLCCWTFPHGCRIIGQVSIVQKMECPVNNMEISLYSDVANSFVLAYSRSVQCPSRSVEITPGHLLTLRYLGPSTGRPLFDGDLLLHLINSCQSHIHHSIFARFRDWSSVFPSPIISTFTGPHWGVYSRKKFLQTYSPESYWHHQLPSLQFVCSRLNKRLSGSTMKSEADRDVYQTSISIADQLSIILEEWISKKRLLLPFSDQIDADNKRRRSASPPTMPLQQPEGDEREMKWSTRCSPLSERLFSIIKSVMSHSSSHNCSVEIQPLLGELLRDLGISQPPRGYHHGIAFFYISNRCGESPASVVLSTPSQFSDWVECTFLIFRSLDDCLRFIQNKQERVKKRLQKKKKLLDMSSENVTLNRRARRQLLSSSRVSPENVLTASIPHYIGFIDAEMVISDSIPLHGSYHIFLGEDARSSFLLMGALSLSLSSWILENICGTNVLKGGSNTAYECSRSTIAAMGSISFATSSTSLEESASTWLVRLHDLSFVFTAPTSASFISSCGSGCNLEITNCSFVENHEISITPIRSIFSYLHLSNGCLCSIMGSLFRGIESQIRKYSLIVCKCKTKVIITDSLLSLCEHSLILLQSSSSLTLRQSRLEKSKRSAICITDPGAVSIENCEICDNRKCGLEIFANSFSSLSSSSIVIRDSTITCNQQSGLLLYRCGCMISSCLISENGSANISCQEGAEIYLVDSVITKSGRSGIHACGGTRVRISDCIIRDNFEGEVDCIDGAVTNEEPTPQAK